MKKRRAFLSTLMVAIALVIGLSACGGPSDAELIRTDLEEYFGKTEEATDQFAEGLESSAGEDLDTLGITEDEFTEAYLDGYDYEIGEITVDGDTATAEVTLSIKSMGDIMTDFQSEFTDWVYSVDASEVTSEDDLYKQAGQILLQVTKDAPATETTHEVKYSKNSDGEWEMDSDSESEIMSSIY